MDIEPKFDSLLDRSRRLLAAVIQLHGEVLAISSPGRLQSAQDNLSLLFRGPSASDSPRQLEANSPIVPGVICSFQAGCGCIAQLAHLPSESDPDLRRLQLNLVEPGDSRWFTLEISVPWSEVRPARTLEWTISARASKPLSCQAMLRATDADGKHQQVGGASFGLHEHPAVIESRFALLLPHTLRFDEFGPPKFILFFEVTAFEVVIEHINITFQ